MPSSAPERGEGAAPCSGPFSPQVIGCAGSGGRSVGRYRPGRETPAQAARREVREELGLEIRGELVELRTLETRSEGKHDTLTLLAGTAATEQLRYSFELREARWLRPDLADVPSGEPVSRWLRLALALDARCSNG